MHDKISSGARGALTRYEVVPVKGGNIRENIPSVLHFRIDEPKGESCVFTMLGMRGGERAANPGLSRRFEQLSC